MRQIPTLLVTVENADSQQQCPMYIAVSIPQDIFQQGLTKSLCSYAVHNLLFNITHVHILYDARVRKPIIFYHAPLTRDSSAAFDSRPGSGILSSSACEGPNSIEVRLKQEQGPAEQKQLRILDCINLDLLVRT